MIDLFLIQKYVIGILIQQEYILPTAEKFVANKLKNWDYYNCNDNKKYHIISIMW